jgi:hypothetical protein
VKRLLLAVFSSRESRSRFSPFQELRGGPEICFPTQPDNLKKIVGPTTSNFVNEVLATPAKLSVIALYFFA